MEPVENPLEQVQRHIVEGEQRIAKQEALIKELERDGHENMLPAAREFLAQMRAIQQQSREHLQREEREAGAGGRPAGG